MAFTENQLTRAGDFYYFPWGLSAAPTIPVQNAAGSNQLAIRNVLDWLTFTSVWFIKNWVATHTLENETVTIVDNCWAGEIDRSAEKLATVTFDWVDTGNLTAFADMFGIILSNVVASTVNITGETVASWDLWVPLLLANPNNVDTWTIVVTETAWPSTLVLDTDYSIYQEGGLTYIIPITAQTFGDIEIAYDYDVMEGQITWYNYEKTSIPYGLYKFVSCPIPFMDWSTAMTRTYTYYFVKHYPNAELTQAFINLSTSELTGSPVSLQGALGGQVIFSYEDVAV